MRTIFFGTLKKIDEHNTSNYGINSGYEIKGFTFMHPTVGNSFIVFHDGTKMFKTSYVTEILSDTKFRTENSTYEWIENK